MRATFPDAQPPVGATPILSYEKVLEPGPEGGGVAPRLERGEAPSADADTVAGVVTAQPGERSRRALPSGRVTFVLTDIEGSTRLLRELEEGYTAILQSHKRLLRESFERYGGIEVGTEGDSMLVAFGDAAAAIAGCLAAQVAMRGHDWPPGAEIRVRIGVHTGEATPIDGDYVALAVHQVARISSGAHGDQVLVSAATAEAVAGKLPEGAELVDLGPFQLRSFPAPVRLYQLRHPDLMAAFPPLRAIGVVAHNLPLLRASFVGRVDERARLASVLRSTGVATIVGPAGVGKTRLAIEVGRDLLPEFADGVWFVDLASLADPALVARSVAGVLGAGEAGAESVEEQLIEVLANNPVLVILDNCEHVISAVAQLAERLTQSCPHLVVLATSREPLGIDGEAVFRIGPLATLETKGLPGADEIATVESVQLFVERAALAQPSFELTNDNAADVVAIIAHLNGIPLAIELAAAALAERSVTGVLRGLTHRFALLTGGRRTAPARHQTLRAALEWSLDLLDPAERVLFDRLAAFAGSGRMDATVAVCAGEPVEAGAIPAMLRHLTRASLLTADTESDRWSMLESIRELAAEELEASGELAQLIERHRSWFVDWTEQTESQLGLRGHGSLMDEVVRDHDNIRRALDSAISAQDAIAALRIGAAMAPFWMSHGDWTEGSRRLRAALDLDRGHPALRARAQAACGNLLLLRGDLSEAETLFAAAQRAEITDDATLARALAGAGFVAFRRSQLDRAQTTWEQARQHAERAGDDRVTAGLLRSLAIAAGTKGDQDRAGDLIKRAIHLARSVGDDQLLRQALGSLAEMHLWLGNYDVAETAYGDALEVATGIGDISSRPLLLAELGWVALLRGDPATAARLSVAAEELAEDLGNPRVHAHAVRLRGEAETRLGSWDEAAASLVEALRLAEGIGAPAEVAGVLCSLGCRALEIADFDEAARRAEAAIELSALEHNMRRTPPAWVLGVAALGAGDMDSASRHFLEGLAAAERGRVRRHIANNEWGLGWVAAGSGRSGEAIACHTRGLQLRAEINDQLGLVDSMVAIADLGAAARAADAAELLGAAEALRAAAGATATPREAAEMERAWAAVLQSADSATAGPRREAGRRLAPEAALALATEIASGSAVATGDGGGGYPAPRA